MKIGDASVKRNKVVGSDYSVAQANDLIQRLESCTTIDEIKAEIQGAKSYSLLSLWGEVATSSVDFQAKQLWSNIIGGASDIDLSVLESGVNPSFVKEVRDKIIFFKGELCSSYKTSTASAYLNSLKRVLKAVEEMYGVRMPLSACKGKSSDPEPIILPFDIVEKIMSASLFGNPFAVLMAIQIEGCMRWDDLRKINKDSFEQSQDKCYIVTIGKNSQMCRRMMREDLWLKCKELFESGKLPNKDYDRYNSEIKAIVGERKVNVKTEVGYGRFIHRKQPICSVVSTHTLRKTGINLWRSRGLDDATIRNRLSYHKSSQVYDKYYLQTTDQILDEKIKTLNYATR